MCCSALRKMSGDVRGISLKKLNTRLTLKSKIDLENLHKSSEGKAWENSNISFCFLIHTHIKFPRKYSKSNEILQAISGRECAYSDALVF